MVLGCNFFSDLVRLCYAFSNNSNSSVISLYLLSSLGTIVSCLHIGKKEENTSKKCMFALMQYLFLTIDLFDPLQQYKNPEEAGVKSVTLFCLNLELCNGI